MQWCIFQFRWQIVLNALVQSLYPITNCASASIHSFFLFISLIHFRTLKLHKTHIHTLTLKCNQVCSFKLFVLWMSRNAVTKYAYKISRFLLCRCLSSFCFLFICIAPKGYSKIEKQRDYISVYAPRLLYTFVDLCRRLLDSALYMWIEGKHRKMIRLPVFYPLSLSLSLFLSRSPSNCAECMSHQNFRGSMFVLTRSTINVMNRLHSAPIAVVAIDELCVYFQNRTEYQVPFTHTHIYRNV